LIIIMESSWISRRSPPTQKLAIRAKAIV